MGGIYNDVAYSERALGRREAGITEGRVELQLLQSGSLCVVSGQTHMKQSLGI